MAKCSSCGKFLAVKGGATCCKCANKYHLACAQLSDSAKVKPDWRCMDCREKMPEANSLVRPVKGIGSDGCEEPFSSPCATFKDAGEGGVLVAQDSPDELLSPNFDIRQEVRLFRSELREMREELKGELRDFRREIAEFRQIVMACNKRIDGLESRLDTIENSPGATASDGVVKQLESKVTQLQLELNDRDQEMLSTDLEIANLPEGSGENVIHTIELVAKKLGVALQPCDIVFAERVGIRQDRLRVAGEAAGDGAASDDGAKAERGRRVVVRLARRQLRDELLRSARVRRGATSADLGLAAPPRRFYLNERLTKTNRQLFYRARQAASLCGWKYTWTKHGKVLTKQGDGKRTFSIRSEADLERVFGHEVSEKSTSVCSSDM